MTPPLAYGDPALEQQAAYLVDHCGTPHDPPFSHSMQRLQIQLIIALDRHEAHRGPTHGLPDRLRIDVIVLVCLHLGLYVLRRNQPHVVPLLLERPP